MGLGENLKKYRKQCSLSQNEAAERLNVTRQTVSKWETDKSKPDVEMMVNLSNLYQVSIEELLENDKEKTENGLHPQKAEETIPGPEKKRYKTEKVLLCIVGMLIACHFPPAGAILSCFLLIFYKSQSKMEKILVKAVAIVCLGYSLYGCYEIAMFLWGPSYGTIEKL